MFSILASVPSHHIAGSNPAKDEILFPTAEEGGWVESTTGTATTSATSNASPSQVKEKEKFWSISIAKHFEKSSAFAKVIVKPSNG
jgi:hypothetical protein